MADNKAITQFKEFSGKLTTLQKALIGSAFLGVIAIMLFILAGASSEKAVLFSNLEENDVAQIVMFLKENNISYEIAANGRAVLVNKNDVLDTRMMLSSNGLPKESSVGYEIFDETNLGMSEFVQKVNYRRALEGELSRTIASFEGIRKSRVHIVIPEKTLFKKDQKEPTASVTLHMSGKRAPSQSAIEGIQNLVSNSVEGMTIDNVKVTDQSGKLLSEEKIDRNSVAGVTEAQHNQKLSVEQTMESKVQSLLDGVIGFGNAQVRVNAELDFTRIEETKKNFDPESQVIRSEQTVAKNSQSADSLSFPYVTMATDEGNSLTNYEISESIEHIIHDVGAIKKLSVAVMINGKTDIVTNEEGKKQIEYSPRGDEEMRQFEDIIKNAVGYDPSRNDQVSVINVPFSHTFDLDNYDLNEEVQWYDNPDNRKIILLLIGILITLVLMFTLVKSSLIKDKIRMALALPPRSGLELAGDKGLMEELQLDDDDMMLLPSDLPEQFYLDGEKRGQLDGRNIQLELEEAMASKPSAGASGMELQSGNYSGSLSDVSALSEERLMIIEMKQKIEAFFESNPGDAVKLIRTVLSQDLDPNRLGEE